MTTYQFLNLGIGNGEFVTYHTELTRFLAELGDAVTLKQLKSRDMLCCGGYGYRLTVHTPEASDKVRTFLQKRYHDLDTITLGHPQFRETGKWFCDVDSEN